MALLPPWPPEETQYVGGQEQSLVTTMPIPGEGHENVSGSSSAHFHLLPSL